MGPASVYRQRVKARVVCAGGSTHFLLGAQRAEHLCAAKLFCAGAGPRGRWLVRKLHGIVVAYPSCLAMHVRSFSPALHLI
jgi:hypothetical protein